MKRRNKATKGSERKKKRKKKKKKKKEKNRSIPRTKVRSMLASNSMTAERIPVVAILVFRSGDCRVAARAFRNPCLHSDLKGMA